MLSLATCLTAFSFILDICAQKHLAAKLLEDSQPRMIANSRNDRIISDPLVVSAQQPLLQFPIPMLPSPLNPFQWKHQTIDAKDLSSQLKDWLQPLQTNLFRPLPLSNTDVLLGTSQAHPATQHLGNFGNKLMDGSSLLLKSMDYEERRQETTKDERVKATIPQKASKGGTESTRSDESLPQSTSVTIHPITTPLDDSRVNGTTDVATNYYDNDLGMEKVPEVEEGGEIAIESTTSSNSSNLMEEKNLQNNLFWNNFLQINVIENATQTSLGNLKEVATTLNLSQAQTAAFVQIIEKIVDEELKRRRDEEMFKSKVTETSEKSKSIAAKFHELYNESEKVESMDGYYEDEITPHEKLTANTRLRFDEQHIIDDYQSGQDEISDARLLESDSREEVRWKAGYMAREQSEYDRLISGTTDATLESDHLDTKSLQDSRRELLRTTVRSTSTAKSPTVSTVHDENVEEPYIQSRTTMIYGKVRTVFERQADDFRSRLLGINGFSDIIKALKHAKIGFFERD